MTNVSPLESAPPPVVLLVEDDIDTRELYEMAFQLEGFRVASCPNAFAALRLAADLAPDAIVTDIGLRGSYDGVHLARQLHESRRTAEIPVIAVTGRQAQDLEHEGVFSEVLQKPVLPNVLVARVREVLRHSQVLRERGKTVLSRVPQLLEKSASLLERSVQLKEMLQGPRAERCCPCCHAPLGWSERRQVLGQTLDYYQPCAGGCGMFYFDNGQQAFVRLIP